ncbi:hypothetical protein NMY22_g4657 [Coprinellus aureogranulatus]|nr:hypothetical protein NMY22_g4657 [Coprinellus aureogranulatus]
MSSSSVPFAGGPASTASVVSSNTLPSLDPSSAASSAQDSSTTQQVLRTSANEALAGQQGSTSVELSPSSIDDLPLPLSSADSCYLSAAGSDLTCSGDGVPESPSLSYHARQLLRSLSTMGLGRWAPWFVTI